MRKLGRGSSEKHYFLHGGERKKKSGFKCSQAVFLCPADTDRRRKALGNAPFRVMSRTILEADLNNV
jgi:hypothetical protein